MLRLFVCSYFHQLKEASSHKLGSTLGDKAAVVESDSDVDDDDFDGYLVKYERSLYGDLKADAFGQDFARYFNFVMCHRVP